MPLAAYSYLIGMGKYELETKDSISKELMPKREDIEDQGEVCVDEESQLIEIQAVTKME